MHYLFLSAAEGQRPILDLFFFLDFLFALCLINSNHRATPKFFPLPPINLYLPLTTYLYLHTYVYLPMYLYIIAADPGASIGLVTIRIYTLFVQSISLRLDWKFLLTEINLRNICS